MISSMFSMETLLGCDYSKARKELSHDRVFLIRKTLESGVNVEMEPEPLQGVSSCLPLDFSV